MFLFFEVNTRRGYLQGRLFSYLSYSEKVEKKTSGTIYVCNKESIKFSCGIPLLSIRNKIFPNIWHENAKAIPDLVGRIFP